MFSLIRKQVISRVLFILIKMGNHLSRTGITSQPQAALKSRFFNGHKSTKPCSRPGFTQPTLLNVAGALLPHPCTLAIQIVLGGMFLWHYPRGYPHWELPSKPDHMGARTFLKKVLFWKQNKTFLRLPLLLSFSIMLNTSKIIYWGCSSAGQSNGFLNRRPWVRIPPVP